MFLHVSLWPYNFAKRLRTSINSFIIGPISTVMFRDSMSPQGYRQWGVEWQIQPKNYSLHCLNDLFPGPNKSQYLHNRLLQLHVVPAVSFTLPYLPSPDLYPPHCTHLPFPRHGPELQWCSGSPSSSTRGRWSPRTGPRGKTSPRGQMLWSHGGCCLPFHRSWPSHYDSPLKKRNMKQKKYSI